MIPNSKPKEVISISEHGMDLLIESINRVYGPAFPTEPIIYEFLYKIASVGLLKIKLIQPWDGEGTAVHSIEEYYDRNDSFAPPPEECLEFLENRAALVALTNQDTARYEHAWIKP